VGQILDLQHDRRHHRHIHLDARERIRITLQERNHTANPAERLPIVQKHDDGLLDGVCLKGKIVHVVANIRDVGNIICIAIDTVVADETEGDRILGKGGHRTVRTGAGWGRQLWVLTYALRACRVFRIPFRYSCSTRI